MYSFLINLIISLKFASGWSVIDPSSYINNKIFSDIAWIDIKNIFWNFLISFCVTFSSFDCIFYWGPKDTEIVIIDINSSVNKANHSIRHHPQIVSNNLEKKKLIQE